MSLRNLYKPGEQKDTSSIGSSEMFTRNVQSQETKKEVLEAIHAPVSIGNDKTKETEEIIQTVSPKIQKEEIIERSKLIYAPDDWNFFGAPDTQSYSMLLSSIYNDGLIHPITVWEQANGTYMILSGHTRERCYDDLYQALDEPERDAYRTIPCKVYAHDALNEDDARRIIILANIAQRAKESRVKQMQSIKELAQLEKKRTNYGSGIDINTTVGKILNCSRSSVCFYKKVSNSLIDGFFKAFCEDKISRRFAEILASKPKEFQAIIEQTDYMVLDTPIGRRGLRRIENTTEQLEELLNNVKSAGNSYFSYSVSSPIKKRMDQRIVPIFLNTEEKKHLINALENASGALFKDTDKAAVTELLKMLK